MEVVVVVAGGRRWLEVVVDVVVDGVVVVGVVVDVVVVAVLNFQVL